MSTALVVVLTIWLSPLALSVLVAPWLLAARLRRAAQR
jgi:hypothetical protein